MFSIFALPSGILGSTTAYITDLFVDIWPIIALAIGLPLAFWVFRKLKGAIPK